jgi:hypothetical protein
MEPSLKQLESDNLEKKKVCSLSLLQTIKIDIASSYRHMYTLLAATKQRLVDRVAREQQRLDVRTLFSQRTKSYAL